MTPAGKTPKQPTFPKYLEAFGLSSQRKLEPTVVRETSQFNSKPSSNSFDAHAAIAKAERIRKMDQAARGISVPTNYGELEQLSASE